MGRLCIAIRTLKRAHYLKRLLASLERNEGLEDVDFYFYVDGPVNPFSGERYAKIEEIVECIKAIRDSSLPNKTIDVKKNNAQTAIQKYEMLSTLFPKYDYVMLLDNDLEVNRYYIKTIRTLFEQFEGDPKAGILGTSYIQPRSRFTANPTEGEWIELEDKVQYGFGQRWEQGFWRETWKTIRPYIEKHYMPNVRCDYKRLLDGHLSTRRNREMILKYFPYPNGDSAFEFAAYRKGYLGLHTELRRHKGIGAQGMYSFRTDEYWEERGFNHVELRDVGDVDEYVFRASMRFAEDYRGQLDGEEVYVVGSGPSLDTYPNDFLDDKIAITLHLAYLKFPETTFRGVCEGRIIKWLKDDQPGFFTKKNIFTWPFHPEDIAQHYMGHDLGESYGWPAPIFVRYIGNESYLYGTTFRALIRKAIKGIPVIAGAYSTVLHSVLFAALTMGAKRICLIGCDHARSRDEKVYYSLAQETEKNTIGLRLYHHSGWWYSKAMMERQRFGTEVFVDECRKHGVLMEQYRDYSDWRKRNGV